MRKTTRFFPGQSVLGRASSAPLLPTLIIVLSLAPTAMAQVEVTTGPDGGIVLDATRTPGNDDLRLAFDGSALRLSNPGPGFSGALAKEADGTDLALSAALTADQPLIIRLGPGDDLLTVDLSLADLPVPIRYDGGEGGFDTLAFVGKREVEDMSYGFINRSDGFVLVAGSEAVHYVGLEPVSSIINAVTVTLNYGIGGEAITVSDAMGNMNVLSTAGESTTFGPPSASFTINAGDTGDDSIEVTALPPAFQADVTLNGNGGNDSVDLSGPVVIGGSGSLTVLAETINISGGLVTTGAGQDYEGPVTLPDGSTLTGTQVNFFDTLVPGGVSSIIGNFLLDVSGDLSVTVIGTTPGADYAQLSVTGGVAISGGLALILSGYTAADGDTIVLIENDGADPVVGAFTGRPEGSVVTTFGDIELVITYAGGDGNDVALVASGPDDGDGEPPIPVELETFRVDGNH